MDIPAVNELVKNFVLDMEIVHYNLVAVIDVDHCSFVELLLGLPRCVLWHTKINGAHNKQLLSCGTMANSTDRSRSR